MSFGITFILILAATAADGLLAGASLDQSIKQLPARHKIGLVAYSEYSRASDLGPGILWYAILGVGAALLTIAAAGAALVQGVPSATATRSTWLPDWLCSTPWRRRRQLRRTSASGGWPRMSGRWCGCSIASSAGRRSGPWCRCSTSARCCGRWLPTSRPFSN